MSSSRMALVWKQIEFWLQKNAVEVFEALQPGASEEELMATERKLGVTFPEDFRASYRIHNGQRGYKDTGILDAKEFLSLEHIVEHWEVFTQLLNSGEFVGLKGDADEAIKPDWWNAKWIPITHDGSGNNCCLDLDPTSRGRSGQIISVWHDSPERDIIAHSFTDWLIEFASDLEDGEYVLSDQYDGLVRFGDL